MDSKPVCPYFLSLFSKSKQSILQVYMAHYLPLYYQVLFIFPPIFNLLLFSSLTFHCSFFILTFFFVQYFFHVGLPLFKMFLFYIYEVFLKNILIVLFLLLYYLQLFYITPNANTAVNTEIPDYQLPLY